jgi:hypothetical protein
LTASISSTSMVPRATNIGAWLGAAAAKLMLAGVAAASGNGGNFESSSKPPFFVGWSISRLASGAAKAARLDERNVSLAGMTTSTETRMVLSPRRL